MITIASVLVMLAGSGTIIAFMLYHRMLYWVDQVVTSSILLNIQIMSEGAALNVQDIMQLNLNDLSIAKAFKEKTLLGNFTLNENYMNDTVIQSFETEAGVVYPASKVNFFVPGATSTDEFSTG